MKKHVYNAKGFINYIVLDDDEPSMAATLMALGLDLLPEDGTAHGVLDVGHIYNPATFNAADPATYDPANEHFPGPTPPEGT